jgi:hypothetical protein
VVSTSDIGSAALLARTNGDQRTFADRAVPFPVDSGGCVLEDEAAMSDVSYISQIEVSISANKLHQLLNGNGFPPPPREAGTSAAPNPRRPLGFHVEDTLCINRALLIKRD